MKDDLLHGGSLDRMREAFPYAPKPWVDLSTGINPWPYPVSPFPSDTLQHLPTQTAYHHCQSVMANAIGASSDTLVLAPGSELLIRLLPRIISPRRVVVLQPSYGDHAQVWRAAGREVIETHDPMSLANTADAVVLCNPNNPDGRLFDPSELKALRRELAKRGGWLIVDEAYAELTPDLSLAQYGGEPGLIVLRSFGKFFGLAGLRLGAMFAPDKILAEMTNLLGVWPVSGLALEVGAQAYADHAWQADMRNRLEEGRKRLDLILREVGFRHVQGTNLFRFVSCEDAHGVWQQLAKAGIYVRRFPWSEEHLRFGLPADEAAEARLRAALSPSA
ncbi:threonine-phosphate decarboxylase CobD [uncultured Hyphomonas sp.]|uniref:threonine-phosphate decarboxylase CobD n=1 Tax=uncultured Hyphomonas sp. TaxID=225298 RepID=UPI0030DB6C56